MSSAVAQPATSDDEVDPLSYSPEPLSESGGRRLVIACDGTWSQPNRPEVTNVVKVSRGVVPIVPAPDSGAGKPVSQIVYYDRGVGTAGFVDSLAGGGFGRGLELNIEEAYRFLVHNYRPGDRIYVFGFSRGAFTARSLVGLIRQCSILKKEHADRVSEGYDAYRAFRIHPNDGYSRVWRHDYSHPMPIIEFVGVWDTVGALGIPTNRVLSIPGYHVGTALRFLKRQTWGRLRGEPDEPARVTTESRGSTGPGSLRGKHRFHDMKLSKYVKTAYHAVAIDERRPIFTAALWDRPPGNLPGSGAEQEIRQAWFPGAHSDVGGGNSNTRNSAITRKWIAEAAKEAGLVFSDDFWSEIKDEISGEWSLSRSPSPFWKLAGSKRRAMWGTDGGTGFVHPSTFERVDGAAYGYLPTNPGYERLAETSRAEVG